MMTKEDFLKRYSFDRDKDRLGAGSFGTVFRAYDNVQDGYVALKIAPVQSESMRLRREVELVKGLGSHQNVASYTECYTFADATGEIDVAVLRYYEEGSLADVMSRGMLPLPDAEALLSQLLDGLEFLHSKGVVHRDLKPGNILMARRPDGTLVPKITDFGISKQSDGDDDATVSPVATVNYASPEQLSGHPSGKNADLWSFGVIAYRLLTGRLPFDSELADRNSLSGKAEIVNKITTGKLPSDIDQLPARWAAVIKNCLVVGPAQRVASEAEIRTILQKSAAMPTRGGAVKTPPSPAVTIAPPIPPSPDNQAKFSSWHIVIVIIVVAVLLVGLIVLVVSIFSEKSKTEPPIAPTWEAQAPDYTPVYEEEAAEVADYENVYVDTTAVYADTVAEYNANEPVHIVDPANEHVDEAVADSTSFFD